MTLRRTRVDDGEVAVDLVRLGEAVRLEALLSERNDPIPVTLGATLGYQTNDIRNFLQAPNTFWAIGPNLVMSLFDGGRRDAEVARAQATLDEAGAR